MSSPTIEEITKANMPLLGTLLNAGISTRFYAKPPVRKEVFVMGVEPNKVGGNIIMWPGVDVGIDLHTDKRRRQAVMNVEEGNRTFTTTVPLFHYHTRVDPSVRWSQRVHERCLDVKCNEMQKLVRSQLITSWNLPSNGWSFKVLSIKQLNTKEDPSHLYGKNTMSVKVEIKRQSSVTSLLLGIDETAHFVAQLPETASSVKEAHELLRPPGLPDDAVRQGEWFFVPATPAEIDAANKVLMAQHRRRRRTYHWGDPTESLVCNRELEPRSSHRALITVAVGAERFAMGLVYDTRAGRHEPIQLDGWHRVIRNREVVARQDSSQITARRRRWD